MARGAPRPRVPSGVAHTATDTLSKAGLKFCVGHSLAPLGLDLPRVVAAVPTERFIIRRREADVTFRLADDSYVDIEEITGEHWADLYNVQLKAATLLEEQRRLVRVIVLYTDRVGPAPETLDGGSIGLRVTNVFGPELDGDGVLAAAEAKVAAGEGLAGDEAMGLAFVGVMRHERRRLVEAMGEALRLAATLPTEREREGCAAAVVMLGQRRLSAEEVAELGEVFAVAAPRMTDVLQRMGREKGRAEGLAEGLAEGREKGRMEGLAEGRAEGREKGRAEGLAESVLLALRVRLDHVPQELDRRVREERRVEVLEGWLKAAMVAPSLEAFAAGLEANPR